MYDLIIAGAGPAGITAGVYAARKRMNFLVISKNVGGQTLLTAGIENYTGYQFVTGPELAVKFKDHAEQFGMPLKEGETVELVEKAGDAVKVKTDRGEYESKAVIVASGRIPRKLRVRGEAEYTAKGVAYCATCDGPVFAGKDVAVIGGGNSAVQAAIQMMKISPVVHLVDAADKFRADPVSTEKVLNADNVKVYHSARVEEIYGDKFVAGMKISDKNGMHDLSVEGVFVEIGSLPASDFVNGVSRDETGQININCKCETTVEGIYAAGDVTSVPAKQIIIACGEGAKACLMAFDYLARRK